LIVNMAGEEGDGREILSLPTRGKRKRGKKGGNTVLSEEPARCRGRKKGKGRAIPPCTSWGKEKKKEKRPCVLSEKVSDRGEGGGGETYLSGYLKKKRRKGRRAAPFGK